MSADDRVYYFSNGTEGEIWSAEWCERCVHDHVTHRSGADYADGCPHIVSMIAGTSDPVFLRLPNDRGYDDLHCTEFARCSCDNGPDDPGVEPPPEPDPNQCVLFDAETITPCVWRDVVLDELTPPRSDA